MSPPTPRQHWQTVEESVNAAPGPTGKASREEWQIGAVTRAAAKKAAAAQETAERENSEGASLTSMAALLFEESQVRNAG